MIWKQLKTVRDPEIPVNIVDLGLIYAAAVRPTRSRRQAHRSPHDADRARLQHVRRRSRPKSSANSPRLPEVREVQRRSRLRSALGQEQDVRGAKLHSVSI